MKSAAVLQPDGTLRLGRDIVRVAIGRAGLTSHKLEGDCATPRGLLALRRVLYRADRVARPRAVVPVELLAPEDGWCDDPGDVAYNRMVRLPYAGRHEELWRRDGLYDVICVLGWNDQPVKRGDGSAIFLHVATADYAPTEGCLAVSQADLTRLLAAGLDAVETG